MVRDAPNIDAAGATGDPVNGSHPEFPLIDNETCYVLPPGPYHGTGHLR
jgi:hypothetical protein